MTPKTKISVDMVENWLGHWRNTANKLAPKEFESFASEGEAFETFGSEHVVFEEFLISDWVVSWLARKV